MFCPVIIHCLLIAVPDPGLSTAVIVGIVVAALLVAALLAAVVIYYRRRITKLKKQVGKYYS